MSGIASCFFQSRDIAMQILAKQAFEHATGAPGGLRLWSPKNYCIWAVAQPWIKCCRVWYGAAPYCAPSAVKMAEGLANQRGETIVSHGAAAATALGLTRQVPMRAVYLTSGLSRRLKLGVQMIEFRHAPIWQLIFPGRTAGEVVRSLA